MRKYSEEFKLKVVQEYLEGVRGYHLLAKERRKTLQKGVNVWDYL